MDKQNQIIDLVKGLQEHLLFLTENAASKEDLRLLETRIDHRLAEVKSEVISHTDGFIQLYQKHEMELVATQGHCYRLDDQVAAIAKRIDLDL